MTDPTAPTASPRRTVHHGDALAWLRENAPLVGASVITSLPDAAELPHVGHEAWRAWFVEAALATLQAVPDEGVAIFFQTDVRKAGLWIDKGALIAVAAERARFGTLFHKNRLPRPARRRHLRRPRYSHLLGFARALRPTFRHVSPDVLPEAGPASGRKAMGALACLEACRFVLHETTTRTIVDPFCGYGTVLAAANALGMDAVGVDLSARMCRRARSLTVALPHAPEPRPDDRAEAERAPSFPHRRRAD